MLILLRETDISGQPIIGSGLLISGKNALEIVLQMQALSPFNEDDAADDIRKVLRTAGDENVALDDQPEEAAREFLERLAARGLAFFKPERIYDECAAAADAAESADGKIDERDEPPADLSAQGPVVVTEEVFNGLEAVRRDGRTNMLDWPVVARLARELGHAAAAEWVEANVALYGRGFFLGFAVASERKEV